MSVTLEIAAFLLFGLVPLHLFGLDCVALRYIPRRPSHVKGGEPSLKPVLVTAGKPRAGVSTSDAAVWPLPGVSRRTRPAAPMRQSVLHKAARDLLIRRPQTVRVGERRELPARIAQLGRVGVARETRSAVLSFGAEVSRNTADIPVAARFRRAFDAGSAGVRAPCDSRLARSLLEDAPTSPRRRPPLRLVLSHSTDGAMLMVVSVRYTKPIGTRIGLPIRVQEGKNVVLTVIRGDGRRAGTCECAGAETPPELHGTLQGFSS